MSQKGTNPPKAGPKKVGSLKLEPLGGRFFDIKPASSGQKPVLGRRGADFFRFALVAVIAFLALSLWNAYVLGRDMVFESSTAARDGYENLKKGMDSLMAQNPQMAEHDFMQAESSFYELSQTTRLITDQDNQMISESLYLDTANTLIEEAMDVTHLGQKLAKLVESFQDVPQAALQLVAGGGGDLIGMLKERKKAYDEIVALAGSVQDKMDNLNDRILPSELRAKVVAARAQTDKFAGQLQLGEDAFGAAFTLLGDKVPHRYMVLLQNTNERRATGGFIGSYLLVDVNDGKIAKIQPHDVYETDGQLADVVPPPPGIDQVADRLYLRDANYSPDFPTSAQKIMWFLEHSRQPSVDSVIAIDQTVVERLLELTGPISVDGLPATVNFGNFSELISFFTEAKISDSVTPKQILFSLIPVFEKKLAGVGELSKLLDLGKDLMAEGHIQAYSSDPQVEKLVTRVGLDGSVGKPDGKTDFLSVITTSIGGNKSDRYIKTHLTHRTVVGEGGQMVDELDIRKTDTFGPNDEARINKLVDRFGFGKLTRGTLLTILGQGPNVDYMRVYVPRGSQLEDTSGTSKSAVNISEDLGYTVFGFKYGPIKPGESKEITFRYLLPFRLSIRPKDDYKFIADRQAGAENMSLRKEIQTAISLKVVESYPPAKKDSLPFLDTAFDRNQIFLSSISATKTD